MISVMDRAFKDSNVEEGTLPIASSLSSSYSCSYVVLLPLVAVALLQPLLLVIHQFVSPMTVRIISGYQFVSDFAFLLDLLTYTLSG